MMPYLVTVKRPDTLDDFDREVFGSRAEDVIAHRILSRVAVATLEEAHRICDDAFNATGLGAHYTLVVPGEAGGTVGPLPDGSLIEVEPIWWDDLRERAGLDRDGFTLDAQTLAAFNEANR